MLSLLSGHLQENFKEGFPFAGVWEAQEFPFSAVPNHKHTLNMLCYVDKEFTLQGPKGETSKQFPVPNGVQFKGSHKNGTGGHSGSSSSSESPRSRKETLATTLTCHKTRVIMQSNLASPPICHHLILKNVWKYVIPRSRRLGINTGRRGGAEYSSHQPISYERRQDSWVLRTHWLHTGARDSYCLGLAPRPWRRHTASWLCCSASRRPFLTARAHPLKK